MQAVVEYFTNAVASFPQYPRWLYIVTVIAIIGLTEAVKLPIKHFTNKVKNDKTRKVINLSVMAVPFVLAFVFGGFYTLIPAPFSIVACVSWATSAMIIYEFAERIIKRVKGGGDVTNETLTQDFSDAKTEVEKADEAFKEQINKLTGKGDK